MWEGGGECRRKRLHPDSFARPVDLQLQFRGDNLCKGRMGLMNMVPLNSITVNRKQASDGLSNNRLKMSP